MIRSHPIETTILGEWILGVPERPIQRILFWLVIFLMHRNSGPYSSINIIDILKYDKFLLYLVVEPAHLLVNMLFKCRIISPSFGLNMETCLSCHQLVLLSIYTPPLQKKKTSVECFMSPCSKWHSKNNYISISNALRLPGNGEELRRNDSERKFSIDLMDFDGGFFS